MLQGDTFGCASQVPAGIRSSICMAAMKAMANVHRRFWVSGGQKKKDGLSKDFWSKQVSLLIPILESPLPSLAAIQ